MNVYVAELSREMARRGLQVDIFTRWHEPEEPQVVALGPNLRVIHVEAGGRGPVSKEEIYPFLPEFLHNLLAFQEQEGLSYQLLHSHYWFSGWVGTFLRRRWRVPHVAMFHTLGAVKNQARVGEHESSVRIKTEQQVIRKADAIVVATIQERRMMERLYRVEPSRIRTIPAGVDLDLFHPIDRLTARERVGLNGEKVLLFVGRPDPLKGLDILLSAIPHLEHPAGVKVVVIGGGGEDVSEGARLRHLVGELAIDSQVSFLGRVARPLLPYYYNAADVCVIPSYYESFGMVAVEAMACGVPVVASRVGGLETTVRDGETGFLIPWHCPEPFAERLELLLGNDQLRLSQSMAARAAVEPYRWSIIADSLLEVYGELVGHASQDAPEPQT